jgi:hypothetical protein
MRDHSDKNCEKLIPISEAAGPSVLQFRIIYLIDTGKRLIKYTNLQAK